MGRHTKNFDQQPDGSRPPGQRGLRPSPRPAPSVRRPYPPQHQPPAETRHDLPPVPPGPRVPPVPAQRAPYRSSGRFPDYASLGSAKREESREQPTKGFLPWVGKVPLMVVLTGVTVVGLVAAALGTNSIALNFTGGSPAESPADPTCGPVGCPVSGEARDITPVAQSVYVAFSTAAHTGGYRGTITLANHGGKSLKGWTLTFKIPGTHVLSVAGAAAVKTGPNVVLKSGQALRPGATARVVFVAKGVAGVPISCLLDSVVCSSQPHN